MLHGHLFIFYHSVQCRIMLQNVHNTDATSLISLHCPLHIFMAWLVLM